MATATVQVRLTLAEDIAQRLRETAHARGVKEDTVVEQALDLLLGLEDTPTFKDYWFSVAAMRADWESMPEDWIADEVINAVPAR